MPSLERCFVCYGIRRVAGCGATSRVLVPRAPFSHDRRSDPLAVISPVPPAGVKPTRDFAACRVVSCGTTTIPTDLTMDTVTTRFGSDHGALRSEDEPLLIGTGRFTDDLEVPGQAYGVFVRA